jgi:hypothetical protein
MSARVSHAEERQAYAEFATQCGEEKCTSTLLPNRPRAPPAP